MDRDCADLRPIAAVNRGAAAADASGRNRRYDRFAIALHWVCAMLVIAVVALIEVKGWFARGSGLRETVREWHYQLGLIVMPLMLIRLLWRFAGRRDAPPAERLAVLMHWAIYLLLLAMPPVGMLALGLAGKPVQLPGWSLPAMTPAAEALAKNFKHLHENAGTVLIVLVLLHVGAALWHRFVRHDDVLRRMLPFRRS